MSTSAWSRDLEKRHHAQTTQYLLDHGITKKILRGPNWRKVAVGFHAPAADDAAITAGQRILDASVRLVPGSAIGGWAAAYLLGADWLDGINPHTFQREPIDLITPSTRRASSAEIRYRLSALPPEDRTVQDGIAITTAGRTAFDGARWASDLSEAVAFLDSMLAFPSAGNALLLEPFCSYVRLHKGWTGVRQAFAAAELARRRVRSGWESRLRVCWQVDAGLPVPMINVPVFGPDEQLLGIADLFDPDAALVAEFDGDQHRDPKQHRDDNLREERFESANITVTRADRVDVRNDRHQLVRRLQDGHRRGRFRDRRLDRWTLRQPNWWLARQQSAT